MFGDIEDVARLYPQASFVGDDPTKKPDMFVPLRGWLSVSIDDDDPETYFNESLMDVDFVDPTPKHSTGNGGVIVGGETKWPVEEGDGFEFHNAFLIDWEVVS